MLYQSIQELYPLPAEEVALFQQKCKPLTYKRKDFLLQAGQTCKGVYFIEKGLLGLYQIKEGKEVYQDFFFEGNFATAIISLSKGIPSEQFLVALEPTTIFYCSKDSLLELYAVSPHFQAFGRALLEQLLVAKTSFIALQTMLSAKEKYQYILEEEPRLIQEVPLQYLSSYLGMARETLSRIRKEK
ncbi:MAG: Crp/Fnr family transcriptional regulator [Aureispira sp.]